MSKVKFLLFSLCLFFSQVVSAYATQAVYVYSGNLFDTFIGPAGYGHETKIAAKFIFDQVYDNIVVDKTSIIDFEISTDGVYYMPASNYFLAKADFTFSAGSITGWDIIALSSNPRILSSNFKDVSYYQVGPEIVYESSLSGKPGIWTLQATTSTVPEPANFALILFGLVLVCSKFSRELIKLAELDHHKTKKTKGVNFESLYVMNK